MRMLFSILAPVVVFVLALGSQCVQAADSEKTVMTVREMCGGCVKKITTRLNQIPNIETIQCDIAKRSVSVTIGAGGPTPRVLWSAIEEIGKTPIQLVGPLGTFTEKPND